MTLIKKGPPARIQNRVLCYMLGFVAVLILLLWLLQIVFLDDFYRYLKMEKLDSAAQLIIDNIKNPNLDSLAKQISMENDQCILVTDENNNVIVSAEAMPTSILQQMSSDARMRYIDEAQSTAEPVIDIFDFQIFLNPGYDHRRYVGNAPRSGEYLLQSVLRTQSIQLADGSEYCLFINALITPVNATIQTLTSQLLMVTGIMLVLAFLLSVLISRRMVEPLVATTQAAVSLREASYRPPASANAYLEIHELNQMLSQAALELGKVEALQHELIANISHDLRTPLTMIGGYAEMMRDIPGECSSDNMQVIIDESQRLTTLVNALLDYSRLQAGETALKDSVFDLTISIEQLLTRYAKLTQQDGYQIQFDYDRHALVYADESQLGQVICNLINNAINYTGTDKLVTVSQRITGDWVTVCIRDTGKGIAPEDQPLIWQRYYRTKDSHKRAIIGTGLGLSIVQKILENHDLPYGLESELNKGTTFWFKIRLASNSDVSA